MLLSTISPQLGLVIRSHKHGPLIDNRHSIPVRFQDELALLLVQESTENLSSTDRKRPAGLLYIVPPSIAIPCTPCFSACTKSFCLLLEHQRVLALQDDPVWNSYWNSDSLTRITADHMNILSREVERLMGIDTYSEEILLSFLQYIPKMPQEPIPGITRISGSASKLFRSLVDFMRERVEENINLKKLAEKAQMNHFQLIRYFAAHSGMTPHAFQLNLKMNEAKRRLRAGDGIATTAHSLGFYDQSHFTRYFCRFLGVPPAQYRRCFGTLRPDPRSSPATALQQ